MQSMVRPVRRRTAEKLHSLFIQKYNLENDYKIPELYEHTAIDDSFVPLSEYIKLINDTGEEYHLSYMRNDMTREEIRSFFKKIKQPLILFVSEDESILPCFVYPENNHFRATYIKGLGHEVVHKDIDEVIDEAELSEKFSNRYVAITCMPNSSELGENDKHTNTKSSGKKTFGVYQYSPIERFLKILKAEKKEIIYIYIYATIAGIISLSLPLGIQSIIGFITSGQVSTSVVVLTAFIVIGIAVSGGLQVMQLTIVEYIQRRLFAKTAFNFAFRVPKIKIESVLGVNTPELMNRFFDTITLQKGIAKILIDFSTALLQVVFGLILLSLYSPAFIIFGIILVAILILIIRITGPRGFATSMKESKFKYALASWFENVAQALSTFKLAGYSPLPLDKTDHFVSNYLDSRKKHFKVLITQYASFIGFKSVITGGLLVLGTALVVNQEINIGQFVASEIIIILIMNAVEKLILNLDTAYDILTSLEKIGAVTDLPIEHMHGTTVEQFSKKKAFDVGLENVSYNYPNSHGLAIKDINMHINASERVCISGGGSSGKTTLINLIIGYLSNYRGKITYDGISLNDINKNSLISHIGDNVSQEDLFESTILENITLGRDNINYEDVLEAAKTVKLMSFINSQKEGFETKIVGGDLRLPSSVAEKIIVARSIVFKPKLLILDDFTSAHEDGVIKSIMDKQNPWTLILISNDENIMKTCDRVYILKNGAVVKSGHYDDIKDDIYTKEVLNVS